MVGEDHEFTKLTGRPRVVRKRSPSASFSVPSLEDAPDTMIATFTHDETKRDLMVVGNDVREIARRLEATVTRLGGVERETGSEARRLETALVATQSWLRARRHSEKGTASA